MSGWELLEVGGRGDERRQAWSGNEEPTVQAARSGVRGGISGGRVQHRAGLCVAIGRADDRSPAKRRTRGVAQPRSEHHTQSEPDTQSEPQRRAGTCRSMDRNPLDRCGAGLSTRARGRYR